MIKKISHWILSLPWQAQIPAWLVFGLMLIPMTIIQIAWWLLSEMTSQAKPIVVRLLWPAIGIIAILMLVEAGGPPMAELIAQLIGCLILVYILWKIVLMQFNSPPKKKR